jgi:hypothetical protein
MYIVILRAGFVFRAEARACGMFGAGARAWHCGVSFAEELRGNVVSAGYSGQGTDL